MKIPVQYCVFGYSLLIHMLEDGLEDVWVFR